MQSWVCDSGSHDAPHRAAGMSARRQVQAKRNLAMPILGQGYSREALLFLVGAHIRHFPTTDRKEAEAILLEDEGSASCSGSRASQSIKKSFAPGFSSRLLQVWMGNQSQVSTLHPLGTRAQPAAMACMLFLDWMI